MPVGGIGDSTTVPWPKALLLVQDGGRQPLRIVEN